MCPGTSKEQYHVECYEPHLWLSYRDTSGKRVDWICQFLGVQATSTEARDRGFCLSFKLDRIDGHGHVSVFFIVTTETSLKTRSMYYSIFITSYHLHWQLFVCVYLCHIHTYYVYNKRWAPASSHLITEAETSKCATGFSFQNLPWSWIARIFSLKALFLHCSV